MRGLLAVECLYHQIIAGNKKQTRRSGGLEVVNDCSVQMNGHQRSPDDWFLCKHTELSYTFIFENKKTGHHEWLKPRYKIGEVLYLKEPTMQAFGVTKYRYSEYEAFDFFRNPDFPLQKITKKWSNKLFMPTSAARAFIRITGIRCERLMAISDQDCIAEGIELVTANKNAYKNYLARPKDGLLQQFATSPKESFLSLYKFANKVKEVPNIWCWVYEIEYLPNYKA